MSTLKKRSELTQTWRLEDLFESDAAWETAIAECDAMLEPFSRYQGKLADRANCLAALQAYFSISNRAERLYSYAHMRRDEDNLVTKYQAMTDRAQALIVRLGAVSAFLLPELTQLSEDAIARYIADPAFRDFDRFLREAMRVKPHTLSAAEERIIAMAGEMTDAPDTVFTMLTDADMVFPEITDAEGKTVRLTQSGYVPLMMSRDRRVRKDAFEALYKTFAGYSNTIAALYTASVKTDGFQSKVAKFPSALASSLFPDEIPEAVYTKLIEETHRHIGSLNAYIKTNMRLMGITDPQMYDLYVSPIEGFALNLPFDEAYGQIERSLSILGADYVRQLATARQSGWIDPYENQGKHSGAYSWGAYGTHPYVLLNYHENLDGLLTVAHEMGHAMHSFYSSGAQPYPKAEYSLFVAEVASTVNEVLVLMDLLDQYPAKDAQAYLLQQLLDTYRTTLFRQTMFAEFERDAHALYEQGEALTHENLSEMYAALNETYYPACRQNPQIRIEWMRIPHFYRAFYVYKYATGFAAATAIARMLRKEGAPAAQRYRAFLSAGSSVSPIDALKLAGVDMSQPEPVREALDLFDELVARYQRIVGEA